MYSWFWKPSYCEAQVPPVLSGQPYPMARVYILVVGPREVIGVMPQAFRFLNAEADVILVIVEAGRSSGGLRSAAEVAAGTGGCGEGEAERCGRSRGKNTAESGLDRGHRVLLDAHADDRADVPRDTKELLKEGVKVLGQAQATLSGKGQALVAISAQLLARLALLSTEITKAALVTSKDPNDKNHWLFKESLLELQNWLGREVTKIDKAISELDAVLVPNAKGVTTRMRVDANTLRNALVALQSEYKDPAGVVQQAIGFTRASLASPENLQQAADALIG